MKSQVKIRFDIITIFPKVFDSYFNESIIKRAQNKKLIEIRIHDLRKYTRNKHHKVDDKQFGGGPGMIIKIEPLANCIYKLLDSSLSNRVAKSVKSNILIILLSASGKQFSSKIAADFSKKYHRIIFICGHYEGVDERIIKLIENWKLKIIELSVGPYVLTGGELPAMVIVDAISRRIPGVLGKEKSLEENRLGVGVPVFTRPEIFIFKNKKYSVPKILLSGNHKKIAEWRMKNQKTNTAK